MLFWYTHSKAIIWALVIVIVLVAIIPVILFVTRENLEIASQLRIHQDIDDLVVTNIRNISNGIIQVCITNDSNEYLLFGYINFSIEHFDFSYWRVLPVRRDVIFPGIGLLIIPNSSSTHNVNFAWFYHSPKHEGLYRIRLETFITYMVSNPNLLVIIHDIAAEFVYDAE